MNYRMTFHVGDIVEAFGCRGRVIEDSHVDTIRVDFGIGSDVFYLDGKYLHWHKEPSLKLIERPKKMVTKTLEGWVNVYAPGEEFPISFHLTRELADQIYIIVKRIACVKVTGTYEVEE